LKEHSFFRGARKSTMATKKIFGQDTAILVALLANVLSWIVRTFAPTLLPRLLPKFEQEDKETLSPSALDTRTRCIVIGRPGGVEQLRLVTLKPSIATCGYNVEGQDLPFTKAILQDNDVPPDCVVIKNEAFSVNYADVVIRWGLYESAKEHVGYPIVPGFDIAGVVEKVGSKVSKLKVGDRVFGCTLFGAYSSRVLVPEMHLRKIPSDLSIAQAASLPTVSLTALYALFLAGQYPTPSRFNNKAILIHSAAGGVGSLLVQMSKVLGLSPIVGVVGRTSKVEAAKALGCDVVIDKSQEDLWESAKAASPNGYAAIMESSGIATLQNSYDHLAFTGRLVVFGFHTNLPMGKDSLSPMEWIKMARKASKMPKFDPMEMGVANKAILAFNLSLFANEREMLSGLFDTIMEWVEQGKIQCPRVVEMNMKKIADAHDLIQSGTTVGKLILNTARE
jgi:NADPH:quinone reductase-like Zn-dependent oxidoreductase